MMKVSAIFSAMVFAQTVDAIKMDSQSSSSQDGGPKITEARLAELAKVCAERFAEVRNEASAKAAAMKIIPDTKVELFDMKDSKLNGQKGVALREALDDHDEKAWVVQLEDPTFGQMTINQKNITPEGVVPQIKWDHIPLSMVRPSAGRSNTPVKALAYPEVWRCINSFLHPSISAYRWVDQRDGLPTIMISIVKHIRSSSKHHEDIGWAVVNHMIAKTREYHRQL